MRRPAIHTLYICTLPVLLLASAGRAQNLTCSTVFLESPSSLVNSNTWDIFHEFVSIRGGHTHFTPSQIIPKQYLGTFNFGEKIQGDYVTLEVYPNGNTTDANSPLNNRGQQSNRGQQGTQVQINRQQAPLQKADPVADRALVEKYIEMLYHDQPFSEAQKAQIVDMTLKTPELLADAKRKAPAFLSVPPGFKISNFDNNRYFWFKPEGSTKLVAARVLDIHRYVQQYSVTILVEYVSENPTLGSRSRKVIELSLNEMTTMIRNEEYSANRSKQEFLESLTPIEIQTAALARKMKMNLYGFTEIGRSVGQDTDYNVQTPLKAISNNSWVAIKASIEREFGSMDFLMSAQERADKEFNFIDAFSRLKPYFQRETRYNNKKSDPKKSDSFFENLIEKNQQADENIRWLV